MWVLKNICICIIRYIRISYVNATISQINNIYLDFEPLVSTFHMGGENL